MAHRWAYPDGIHFESFPVSLGRRMPTGKGRPLGRPPHKNSKAAPLQPGDEVGAYTYAQLLRMDRRYVAAAEEAIRLGLERRTSAFAEQRTGASDRARGRETGIYNATLRWARIRIGVIMNVTCCVSLSCLATGGARKDASVEVRVLPDCANALIEPVIRRRQHPPGAVDRRLTHRARNTPPRRQGAAWLASFRCSGSGLTWLEDDEIRVSKDGWTLEAKIKNVRRVGDPIRYCLLNEC